MNTRWKIPLTLPFLLLAALAGLSCCGLPLTDGATRLAGEIRGAAKRLRDSSENRLEMKHRPLSWPDGVKGRYEIVFQASLDHPRSGGSLLVGDLDSSGYRKWGYNWSTTYHLNFVRVPRELRIRKNAGEAVVVVLERRADGTVDVTDLKSDLSKNRNLTGENPQV